MRYSRYFNQICLFTAVGFLSGCVLLHLLTRLLDLNAALWIEKLFSPIPNCIEGWILLFAAILIPTAVGFFWGRGARSCWSAILVPIPALIIGALGIVLICVILATIVGFITGEIWKIIGALAALGVIIAGSIPPVYFFAGVFTRIR